VNQKTLIGLAIAALAAIVIAIAVSHSNKPRTESSGGAADTYLVPALRDHVNDVDKVVVTGAGNKAVATMTRDANGWSIAEKNGFAVDTGKLREFLLKLADAKLVEQKTSNKDKYATLGVEDVAGADAKSVEVEIGGLAQPVKLVVGNSNAHGGTFVRRAGEAESWLASGNIAVDKKVENWLRKDLADVAANRVASVSITRPDGKTVRIAKDSEGDANFKLADVPKGREPASEFAVNGVAATLGGLRFDDVVPAKDAAPPEKPLNARFATFDGLVVEVVAWEKDGKDYAQLTASTDKEQATRHAAAEQAQPKADDTKSADAKSDASPPADGAKSTQDTIAALDKEAADLNHRFKGWTFVLPAYKYASLDKSPDDLLKPLDDKKNAPAKKPDAKAPAKKPAPAKNAG
jgi:uncharacterized protein DUF4340